MSLLRRKFVAQSYKQYSSILRTLSSQVLWILHFYIFGLFKLYMSWKGYQFVTKGYEFVNKERRQQKVKIYALFLFVRAAIYVSTVMGRRKIIVRQPNLEVKNHQFFYFHLNNEYIKWHRFFGNEANILQNHHAGTNLVTLLHKIRHRHRNV